MATTPQGRHGLGYRERLDYFENADTEKNLMIEDLIENLENARLDLESERVGRRRLQDRVIELENLTRLHNGRAFVMVLIDADADDYLFREKFLNHDTAGGRDAADGLNDGIKNHLQSLGIDPANTEIMIRAYADIKALQGACIKHNKMKNGSNLYHFAHGFNQRQALFDYVDVGPGKEGADNKIRESLEFFISNHQCKHIIFGACQDSGYAPFLGKFAADASARNRITLLQGPNTHPRIAALGFKRSLKLDTIFSPHGMSANPAVQPAVSSKSSSPPVIARSAGSASAPGQYVAINPAPLFERLGPVIIDGEGKRVDKVLNIDVTSPYINVLRQNKLCPWYYLRGRCEGCDKSHVASPLKAKEFDYLWYVARQGVCFKVRKGKVCNDDKCIYGHEEGFPVGTGGA